MSSEAALRSGCTQAQNNLSNASPDVFNWLGLVLWVGMESEIDSVQSMERLKVSLRWHKVALDRLDLGKSLPLYAPSRVICAH